MSTTAELTPEETAFLLDTIIRPGSSGHNNHHFADDGDDDEAMLAALMARDLVYRTPQPFQAGGWIYHVTLAGRKALAAIASAGATAC